MPSISYNDDAEQKRGMQQDKLNAPQPVSGPSPTFSELQRMGRPRPPSPAVNALYSAAGQPPPPAYGAPPMQAPAPYGVAGGGVSGPPSPSAPPHQPMNVAGPSAQDYTQRAPPRPGSPYVPTNQLNQSNLEGYLYDLLANPTASPTYKNTMRRVGADIDTDASRRGVFYSTIPVNSYSEAGSNLATGLQGQAFNQLQGYNQEYEQLMMALLGAT